MTQRVARPMKFAAFISLIVSVAVLFAACAGAVGPKGDPGDPGKDGADGKDGAPGAPGAPGKDAPLNMAPQLKPDMALGAQHFALASTGDTTGGERIVHELMVSDYFEDPEGVLELIYSVAELSADDMSVVDVYLNDMTNVDTSGAAPALIGTPVHKKAGVQTSAAYLAIMAKAAGSVNLELTVKDGFGGMHMEQISITVVATNSPPTVDTAVFTAEKATEMSRIGAKRLSVTAGAVTVMLPNGLFKDADGDALKIEAMVEGDGEDAITANKALLDASISAAGDLVLTPKKGGATTIPVVLKATDRYGASVMTAEGAGGVQAEVNVPPMYVTYADSGLTAPTGKEDTDDAVLADLTTTTFSIAVTNAGDPNTPGTLLTLANHFTDADTEDNFADADLTNGSCDFTATSSEYATVAFNAGRLAITIVGKKVGSFDVTVTCTDTKGESIKDSVTVTIVN